MPYINSGVQYSGLWTRAQQMQAVAAGTWTFAPTPLYSWGQNDLGQLGLGNVTNYSSPKQISATDSWLQISGGYKFFTGVKVNGTLWTWGWNNFGQLGLGNTTNYSSAKQVGSLTNWQSVSNGSYHVLAVKTDGTLWSWGYNAQGGLGLGNTTNYSSPKQIGSGTNWVTVAAAGVFNSYAIKTDGTLWAWGRNTEGELGLGNTTDYSSPKQVGALTNWSKISGFYYGVLAIKTNGTLWAWGKNNYGQLGLGNTTYYSSPKQVGALTNWSGLATSMAVAVAVGASKTDGTLWMWGDNSYGQAGQGTSGTTFSSPKQVGSLTNWTSQISIGQLTVNAVKSDGTWWSWGGGLYGTLGRGNTTSYSSPKQLGALTTWIKVAAGAYSTYGLTS